MPDTLSSFSEAMGLIPDNTSRLISPDDQRSVAISLMPDRGGCFGDSGLGPWSIPMPVVDDWVDINQSIDMVFSPASVFWRMDANGALIYNYAADWPTIVVPPGHLRAVRALAVIDFDPDNNVWQFALALGQVPQPPFFTIDAASTAAAMTITVAGGQGVDVSAAPPVSLMARNRSNTTALALNLFSLSVTGGALA